MRAIAVAPARPETAGLIELPEPPPVDGLGFLSARA
jgi:hypothetical protein